MWQRKRTGVRSLQEFLGILRRERELVEITAEVDPNLEVAEIHRRVIERGGPALLFTRVKGASFPLVTNLFGTTRRVDLAFGGRPEELMREVAELPHTLMPPTLGKVWEHRHTMAGLARVGLRRRPFDSSLFVETPPRLGRLPLITSWPLDGGPFITLPLVYTEHPVTKVHNLGMYRIQRFDEDTTGLHCQIGKGGGYHLAAAKALGQRLPVNITVGGPPALILGAIAPLPENVPELLFTSFVLGERLSLLDNPIGDLPLVESAEFTIVGEVDPHEMRPEGPFGDHYGYYSLRHDYPVFRCKGIVRRPDAVFPATVVGKPRQEDFYIGEYLQRLMSPLFPLVMPQVLDLWSYGETGFHALASAVVQERYSRECLQSAFRILGEGQLSLTKFLLLTDQRMDLANFRGVLEHILARADFATDLFVFSNTAMDTLDYTGPKVNHGSKGVLIGVGEARRALPQEVPQALPPGVRAAGVFCPGCLVIEGPGFGQAKEFAQAVARHEALGGWPLVVLVDSVREALKDASAFLWTTFTRFEPAADIYASKESLSRHHIGYAPPIVIDARWKPWYPAVVACDENTSRLVDRRWGEYF